MQSSELVIGFVPQKTRQWQCNNVSQIGISQVDIAQSYESTDFVVALASPGFCWFGCSLPAKYKPVAVAIGPNS